MPEPGVTASERRKRGGRRPAGLPSAVEGLIAEICRDLAVQAKRMRQLQEQADELRTAIRLWAGRSDADSSHEPGTRGDDAEKRGADVRTANQVRPAAPKENSNDV